MKMKGCVYSYSERQLLIYNFIKRVGPSPEPALEVLFGLHAVKALNRLKQFGYLRKCEMQGVDFWVPFDYGDFDFSKQETIAWFAVRLEEAGGKYKGDYGTSPKGNKFMLGYSPGCINITDEQKRKFVVRLEDLKHLQFIHCLRWEKKTKPIDKNWKQS